MLEVIDLGVRPQPVVFLAKPLHPFHQHPAIPGAVKNSQPAAPGHVAPKPPQVRLRRLLVCRCRHGNHLVLPRIQRRANAPNRAALAGRVSAFKGTHHRTTLEVRMPHQLRQPPLPFRQRIFIRLVSQRVGQVQLGQHVTPVQPHTNHGRHQRRRHLGRGQPGLQSLQQDLSDRERAVAVVRALHHHPRRPRRVGHAQKMAGHILQLVVGLEPVPVPLGHAPGGTGIALQVFESFFLPLFGQVKPELQHQSALAGQHGLKPVDLVGTGVQFFEGNAAFNALANRVRIPRTRKNTHAPLGRQ